MIDVREAALDLPLPLAHHQVMAVIDQDLVRRSINRLQENMETRLRKAGLAVERDDVIQASPNTAKEGYRLNPFKAAIRPLLDGDS